MNIIDIITKKRNGGELSEGEIAFVVEENLPDYQLSAFLTAVCIKGMTERETLYLTHELAGSGVQFTFTSKRSFVDLHSTGGVGDKCTLIVCPIVAACGVKVAKLAGRGLGHTGGTIDKLAVFKGINTSLTPNKFQKQVEEIGIAIAEQTTEITPKDGEFYRLRDVTGTTDSIPLIASSIMSKKIATGCPNIMLDVTYGNGAFMKTKKEAQKLAKLMRNIAFRSGRNVLIALTPMDVPLGNAVGHTLEMDEAIAFLKGEIPAADLQKVCFLLAVDMIKLGLNIDIFKAFKMVEEVIANGKALQKLCEMVEYQEGVWSEKFPKARIIEQKTLENINAYEIGDMVRRLGGGRYEKDDKIDLEVGIKFINKAEKEVEIHKNVD